MQPTIAIPGQRTMEKRRARCVQVEQVIPGNGLPAKSARGVPWKGFCCQQSLAFASLHELARGTILGELSIPHNVQTLPANA
jgi:hypothetical protein